MSTTLDQLLCESGQQIDGHARFGTSMVLEERLSEPAKPALHSFGRGGSAFEGPRNRRACAQELAGDRAAGPAPFVRFSTRSIRQ